MQCIRCKKEHDGSFASGKYCSRSCSNARNHSIETKKKIAKSNSKDKPWFGKELVCVCGKPYKLIRRETQKYCSRPCAQRTNIKSAIISNSQNDEWKQKISITRKRMFAEGKLDVTGGTTEWIPYKNIKVQGSYEYRTCVILDEWKKLNKIYDWEYTNDRIEYIHNEETRTYLLDFKVFTSETQFYYIETKGYSTEVDISKWKYAENIIPLEIWYEKDIIAAEANLVEASV